MGDSISFSEFEKYSRNTEDDIAWAIAQAKLKKVTPKLRKFDKAFDEFIRTNHFEDAFAVLTEALILINRDTKTNWNLYFQDLFNGYPPRGLFGYYGRVVSALYISDEILELIDHVDQFIPVKGRELTVVNVQQTNGQLQKIRESISEAGEIRINELRETVPDLGKSGVDWRLRLLDRCREIKIQKDLVIWVPSSERYPAINVPIFSKYYAKYADMGAEQRAFFNDVFKPKFLAGEDVDVDNNWSYVFVLLHEMIRKRTKYQEELPAALERAYKMAPNESIGNYSIFWLADLRFEQSDFDGGFEILVRGLSTPDRVLARATMVPEHRLHAKELLAFTSGSDGLATIGKREFNKVLPFLQHNLDQFHEINGKSLVTDLWERIVNHVEKKQPLVWDRDEGMPFISADQANELLKDVRSLFHTDPPTELFFGVPGVKYKEVEWPKPFPDIGFEGLRDVFTFRMKSELRRAENDYRDSVGLPRIGEGWVSEVQLLNEVKDAFPEHWIVHQGRPKWLKQQSLDIYFPDVNIGIEYQGAQHTRPVGFFGGEETFLAQQERDERKRELCRLNGCELIEVHPGYEISNVFEQIKVAIAKQSN